MFVGVFRYCPASHSQFLGETPDAKPPPNILFGQAVQLLPFHTLFDAHEQYFADPLAVRTVTSEVEFAGHI